MHTHIGKATKYVASIAGGVIRWTLFIPIVLGIAAVPIFPELPPGDAAPLIAFLSGTLLNFVQAEGVALRVMRKRTARSQAWTLVSTAGLTFASLFWLAGDTGSSTQDTLQQVGTFLRYFAAVTAPIIIAITITAKRDQTRRKERQQPRQPSTAKPSAHQEAIMPTCIAGFTTKKTVGQTLEGMDIKLLQSDADVTDFIVTDSTCQLRIRLRLIAKQVSDDIATVPDIVATLEVMMLKDELLRLPSQEMTPSEAVKRAVQFIQTWHATKQALHDQAEAIAK